MDDTQKTTDLKTLNPRNSDLILLISNCYPLDFERAISRDPFYLAVFDRFIETPGKSGLFIRPTTNRSTYIFAADSVIMLHPAKLICNVNLSINPTQLYIPNLKIIEKSNEKLNLIDVTVQQVHKGVEQIAQALRAERGYEVYADWLDTQAKPFYHRLNFLACEKIIYNI